MTRDRALSLISTPRMSSPRCRSVADALLLENREQYYTRLYRPQMNQYGDGAQDRKPVIGEPGISCLAKRQYNFFGSGLGAAAKSMYSGLVTSDFERQLEKQVHYLQRQ